MALFPPLDGFSQASSGESLSHSCGSPPASLPPGPVSVCADNTIEEPELHTIYAEILQRVSQSTSVGQEWQAGQSASRSLVFAPPSHVLALQLHLQYCYACTVCQERVHTALFAYWRSQESWRRLGTASIQY